MKNANPVFRAGALAVALLLAAGCNKGAVAHADSIPPLPAAPTIAHYTYEVVRAWPHDRGAFTQGLVWRDGELLESTGLNGESSLREVELESGRILKRVDVAREYFAEGLAVIGGEAYQLTWKNGVGFVYDADTFAREKTFDYTGEGWGLATDGRLLVLSDGTNRIRFLDPRDGFKTVHAIDVTEDGRPVERLNELEFIRGEIFANVWQTDEVVRIDAATGNVRGVVDFSGLLPTTERTPETDVLNGIAYDEKRDRLFVTGKRWPKIFEIRLRTK
ncbi:MAG TPA: glutaminyl-peptide cyclotransferase [Opitutaceae bacterium]|nr:glutaminyl-peptide cyclotransferase [Opitutaceae bacterium]